MPKVIKIGNTDGCEFHYRGYCEHNTMEDSIQYVLDDIKARFESYGDDPEEEDIHLTLTSLDEDSVRTFAHGANMECNIAKDLHVTKISLYGEFEDGGMEYIILNR